MSNISGQEIVGVADPTNMFSVFAVLLGLAVIVGILYVFSQLIGD